VSSDVSLVSDLQCRTQRLIYFCGWRVGEVALTSATEYLCQLWLKSIHCTEIHFLYVQINYVNPLLSPDAYFVFFELTVFSITVFAVCSAVTFAFVICFNNRVQRYRVTVLPKNITPPLRIFQWRRYQDHS